MPDDDAVRRGTLDDARILLLHLFGKARPYDRTREQVAFELGWTRGHGAQPAADVQRVRRAQALTKDQFDHPVHFAVLGGFMIGYAPVLGGFTVFHPEDIQNDTELVHMLIGNLQRTQQHKTENRRMCNVLNVAGRSWSVSGDHDVARLLWAYENEVDRSGFPTDTTVTELFHLFRSRGWMG